MGKHLVPASAWVGHLGGECKRNTVGERKKQECLEEVGREVALASASMLALTNSGLDQEESMAPTWE